MSTYKASLSRPQANKDSSESKYRQQAQQLQELFPTWSNEGMYPISAKRPRSYCFSSTQRVDLQTVLTEVSGDVEMAATRISEGTVTHHFSEKMHRKLTSASTNFSAVVRM